MQGHLPWQQADPETKRRSTSASSILCRLNCTRAARLGSLPPLTLNAPLSQAFLCYIAGKCPNISNMHDEQGARRARRWAWAADSTATKLEGRAWRAQTCVPDLATQDSVRCRAMGSRTHMHGQCVAATEQLAHKGQARPHSLIAVLIEEHARQGRCGGELASETPHSTAVLKLKLNWPLWRAPP